MIKRVAGEVEMRYTLINTIAKWILLLAPTPLSLKLELINIGENDII